MAHETHPPALDPSKPADAALLAILVAVAFADGELDDAEIRLLDRVLPGRTPDALRQWARQAGARPPKLDIIARALPDPEERWRALRFAVRMAWNDGAIAGTEWDVLTQLVRAFGLPADALERATHELSARASKVVDPNRILEEFKALKWDAVDWAEGPVLGPLGRLVPAGARGVLRVGIDGVEVLGLYREGLVAHFRDGGAFLPWADVVTFTRASTLSAAVELHTEDGRRHALLDFRLAGIGGLLDRLYSGHERSRSAPPAVRMVQGAEGD